jgi:hypothetical protein
MLLLGLAALTAAAACGKNDSGGPAGNGGPYPFTNVAAPSNGVAQFGVIPVAPGPGLSLTALGNLNPPGHVLPTDHVYFYPVDLSAQAHSPGTATRNVYMPATGALFMKLQPGGTDWKLMFRAKENFYFYLDHVLPSIATDIGDVIQAGTLIGTTDPGGTLDLGAFDMTVTHDGFLTPARYSSQTLHYVSPWKYFAPALQPALYAQVYRSPSAADKDGRIDFGVAGKLAGDWFLQGMPADSSGGPYGWTRSVAFVYDYYDPSKVRISIGGTIGPAGVWAIDAVAPRPETVSVANGVVPYRLLYTEGNTQYGLMLVQMVTDTQIRIELFVGSSASTGLFDSNAYTFVR